MIPGEWAMEFKMVRPFGDNGKEAEHWSQNALHPYRGNTSAFGDALKLRNSSFSEAKAIIIFGYEHEPSQIDLEPCIRGFELLARDVGEISLGPRQMARFAPLIHPVHQVGRIYAWELLP